MKITTITLCCLFLLCGCRNSAKNFSIDSDNALTIAAPTIEESFEDTTYLRNVRTVILETNDESIIASMDRISTENDILFIFDAKQMKIFLFDMTGKFIDKVAHIGQGPGEYVQISDFALDIEKKQIVLLCDIPNKIMYYTYDGVFVKEEKMEHYYSQIAIGDKCICLDRMSSNGLEDYQLLVLNKETGGKEEWIKQLNIENRLFIAGNSLSKGKDLLYTRRFDNSIYKSDKGRVRKEYSIDFKKHSFPERLMNEKDAGIISKECRENEYNYSIVNATSCDKYLLFKTNLGMYIHDKESNTTKGFKEVLNTKLNIPFHSYMLLENTQNIICSIDDPSYIKRFIERLSEKEKQNPKYSEHAKIAKELVDENNPVLFIYEFKN